jgi:hypothetical protein
MPVQSAGFPLTVSGTSFLAGSTITFGSTVLPTTLVNTTLTATVPAGLLTTAGTVNVVVTNPGGSASPPAPFLINPKITSLSPANIGAGSGQFTLTVNGTTFVAGTVVTFGGTPLTTTFLNSGTVTAIVPANLITNSGPVSVIVTIPTNNASAPATFVVNPRITSLSPPSVIVGSAQFTLTVSGAGFVTGSIVSLNGTALSTTVVNGGSLTAIVPANLLAITGSFPVVVTNPGNNVSAPAAFGVTQAPISLSPPSIPANSPQFTLTVNGSVFQSNSTVTFNGTSLATKFVSSSLLTATVPASLITTTGVVPVVVVNPGAASSLPATFTVTPGLAITTTSLGGGQAGVFYTATVTGTGGAPPVLWSAVGLPASLAINAQTGVISGVPLQAGSFAVTVTLQDSVGGSVSARYSLVIAPPPLTISTGNLPNGQVGVPYVGVIGASGGTGSYTFALTGGKLPDGLTLSSNGSVTGTPTTPGTFSFSVNVTDSAGATNGRGFTVTIIPAPLVISGGTNSGTSGSPINSTFTITGGIGPYKCSVSGDLPPGTTFSGCTLSGTPTTPGTYTFRVTVTDSTGTTTFKDVTITIAPATLTLAGTVGGGQVGVAYSGQLTASGGTQPYSYSASGLPDGLSVASSSGAITGTPGTAGPFTINAAVVDSTGAKATATFNIVIAPPDLVITTTSLPDGTVGVAYSAAVRATGGVQPYTFTISGLPDGLTGNSSGAISGTPTTAGKFTVNVSVKDNAPSPSASEAPRATVSKPFTLTIAPPQIVITTATVPGATVGTAYSATLSATGGVGQLTWSATGLPSPLTISTAGVITGTPAAPGSFPFTATVKDPAGNQASKQFTLTIVLPPAPPLTFSGIGTPAPPLQQPNLQISIATVYPVDILATLTLTFAPDSGAGDPTIQFATGGRTTTIRIPAGSTVGANTVGVQTGTVAGLITITAQLTAVGQDVTPTPPPTFTIRIAPMAPVPTTVTATRNSTGFTVNIMGYVTDREVTQALFTFNAAPGSNLQTTSLTLPVDTIFAQYFGSSAALPTGGQFLFTQAFTINGNLQAVTSVTVTLVNKIGQSTAVTVNLN